MDALGTIGAIALLITLGVFFVKKAKKNGGGVRNASHRKMAPRHDPWMKR